MKRLFLSFCFVVLTCFLSTMVWADSTVTFGWDPNIESDLKEYRLYQTEVKGEYILDVDLAVAVIPAGTEIYALPHVSDGEHWWILTALDFHSNQSDRSNEVGVELDTEAPLAPGIRVISVEVNK